MKLKLFSPDIVHIHNTFPLISPAIFYALDSRMPRVLTLHNYRLFCPAGLPLRSGNICTTCIERRNTLPSVIHGCYRDSSIATIPLAISVELHRSLGTWKNQVDRFITFSDFQMQKMISAGLPSEKIMIKPNFFPGNPVVVPWKNRGDYIVFVGRLSPEKGICNLVRAWKIW